MNRRSFLYSGAVSAIGLVVAPFANRGRYQLFADSPTQYSNRAIELVGRSTVIDMLGLLKVGPSPWLRNPDTFTLTDWQRFKDSGISVFHPSVGYEGTGAFDFRVRLDASWNSLIANHDRWLMRVDSADDLQRIKGSGKIGVLLGAQDAAHFRSPADVDLFYSLGERVCGLTYNTRNLIGNGAFERRDDGISDFGIAIIARMNAVGMAVDVSHCGDRTTLEAFELSKPPVLITHANCRALTPGHPRCKTDEAIMRLGGAGSVIGITHARNFTTTDEPTTIEDVLNHFDHVRTLIGPEHLGVGSDQDLDGADSLPPEARAQAAAQRAKRDPRYRFRDRMNIDGLDHPRRMFDLTEGLIRRKYSDRDIEGILGGNFKRVLAQIWRPQSASGTRPASATP
jgi:membrane dipeptidase